MKKLFSLCLVFVLLFSAASAEKFTLRKGITWGDSELDFLRKIADEGFDQVYSAGDIPDLNLGEYPGSWIRLVSDISLGKDDENVALFAAGTEQDGLFLICYWIFCDNMYNRATELTASLGKKYGKFDTRGKNDSYQAWRYLDDGTGILVYISDGMLWVQYTPPNWEDINAQIEDGSFFISTPFGL